MGKSILTANQKRILEAAAKVSSITDNFYLTGGTALAEFYYQHRVSEDLDFFSEKELDEQEILSWVKQTKEKLRVERVEQQELRGQLVFFFHFKTEVIKVDFAYFPFEHVGKFKTLEGLKIASEDDIAVNKVQALLNRKRARDYYDLYEIIKRTGWGWRKLQTDYAVKFGVSVSGQELAKVCAGVLDASDLPRFLGEVDWKKVEGFFVNEAKKMK